MRLSVIIPVYNAQSYLNKCLDSVFCQDLLPSQFEVIAINDGSTDATLEILNTYKNKYPNLIVHSQENKGEAETRNRAIDIAKGKYIAFVDSDDSVKSNTFTTILDKAEKLNLDILYLNMSLYDEKGIFLYQYPSVGVENTVLNGFDHPRRTFPATLYRTELAKKFKFRKEIIIGPDTVFNTMVQSFSKRCSYISIPHYNYTHRDDSLSKQSSSEKAYNGFLNAIEILVNFQSKEFSSKSLNQKKYFDSVLILFMTRIIENNILPTFDKKRVLELKKLLNNLDINYLSDEISTKFNYFNSNYIIFFGYNKILNFKQLIYFTAHTIKNKLKKI